MARLPEAFAAVIGVSVLRPELLLLLLLVPAVYVAWRLWPPPLQARRSALSLALRITLVALLVFALAGSRLTTQPQKRAIVAVVDLSGSVRDNQQAPVDEEAAVRSLMAAKGPDDLFGVVTFAHDAAVEMPLTKDPAFDVFQTQPDEKYTNIAEALRLAAGLIPEGYARQLVLISDGRQNLGDAAAAAAALRAEGVRVDVYPTGGGPAAEALVLGVEAPTELRDGQVATVNVRLRSTTTAIGTLSLQVDGREVGARAITLQPGTSSQSFEVPGLAPGLHRIRAELNVQPDTYSQNNIGEAAIRVLGRPLVLVLEGRAGEGANVEAALKANGIGVDRRLASQTPSDTSTLGRYDSAVLVDVPADAFPRDTMATLAATVHDLGHGLVTIGGPNTYGPGGWLGTPLEDALPLRMDIPKRNEKPKVAVVLVMETMEDPRADQVTLGAAEAVIDKLTPEDQVAVTDGLNTNGFVVPMTSVTDKAAIDHQLEATRLGDPASYLPFIKEAGDALLKTDAPLKHIVLLGDGDASVEAGPGGGSGGLQSLLEGLNSKGVTTSAIAVDVHSSSTYMAYMQDIARWGGGRFYESNDPSQVPQLFLKESQVALRPWFEQTPFFPKLTAAGDLLAGVKLDAFPELGGYVVTTPKPASEVYFTSPKDDPVLASWNYGLGRTVAWTSDSNGIWTAGFLRSPLSAELFARMVAWSLPGGAPDKLRLDTALAGDGLSLTVTGPQTSGATLSVGIITPGLESSRQDLAASGPGAWHGQIPASDVGTYLVHASLRRDGTVLAQADAAVSVPYSPEYLDLGRDEGMLRLLARVGSGTILTKVAQAWHLPSLPVPISSDVFWLLVLVAAILWPVDIAVRRLTLSPRELLSVAGAVVRLQRPREVELATPPELARLQGRLRGYRRRRVQARPVSVIPEAGRPPEAATVAAKSTDAARAARMEQQALSARLLEARRRRRGKGD